MQKLDDVIHSIERVVLLVCVAMMTLLVGADVVQRTFSRPVGKTGQLLAWAGETLAGPLAPERRALLEGAVGEAVFAFAALAFCVLAVHASRQVAAERSGAPAPGPGLSVAIGVGVAGAAALAVQVLLWAFPSSLPGAQKFALGFMLWSGMLGATVAARERRHIVVDAVTKKLDDDNRRLFALLGGVAAASFCAVVGGLGAVQLAGEFEEWRTHDGVGVYESLPVPTWIATLSIPTAFLLMGARFLAYGMRDFRHGPPAGGDGGHGVDLEELKGQALDVAAGGGAGSDESTGVSIGAGSGMVEEAR